MENIRQSWGKNLFPGTISAMVFLTICVLILLTLPSTQARANPSLSIGEIQVTNLRDGSFVVSWTTDTPSDGRVDWGLTTPPGNTTYDSVVDTTTHYVTVSGLSPGTTYFFQLRSGSVIDNNNGSYYQVTTGPTLSIPNPGKTLWGYVYQADGSTPVPNAIVYIQLQDSDGLGSPDHSQWASARADASGIWSFDLANLRTTDGSAYFSFSDGVDALRMAWNGGSQGHSGSPEDPIVSLIPSTYPAQIDQVLANPEYRTFIPMVFH